MYTATCMTPDMGLAPGGRMRQEIYEDPYGLDAWDLRQSQSLLCFHRQHGTVDGHHRRDSANPIAHG